MNSTAPQLLDHLGRPLPSPSLNATYTLKELDVIIARETGAYRGTASHPFAQVATVYSCILQIANSFAQIPWGIWRRSNSAVGKRRGYSRDLDGPILQRMKMPNEKQDEFRFKEDWATLLLSGGNVWMYIDEPDSRGIPRSLMLFGRNQVSPIRAGPYMPLYGWVLRVGNKSVNVGLDEMAHWRLPNDWDDVLGLSPVEAAKAQIDAEYAESLFESRFYNNSASPSGILLHKPGPLDPEQRAEVRQSFEEVYSGPRNAGKLVVLGSDFDLKILGFPQSQTQFYESKTLNREQIAAAFFGFPVVLLNSEKSSGLNRSELEAARLIMYENCTIPLTQRMTPAFNAKFVSKIDPNAEMFFDCDIVPVVLKADLKTKSSILSEMVKSGVPLNAAVQLLDLDLAPIDGGDVGYLPSNVLPLGDLEDGAGVAQPPVSPPQEVDKPQLPGKKEEAKPPGGGRKKSSLLDPLINRAERKIKRVLYCLRRAILLGESHAELRDDWIRLLLPISAAAVQAGAAHARGEKCWLEVDGVDAEEALSNLQANVYSIQFAGTAMESVCEGQMKRMVRLFDVLCSAVRREDTKKHLSSINQLSAALAKRLVIWSYNGGVYAGGTTWPSRDNGTSRYSGDHHLDISVAWDDVQVASIDVASGKVLPFSV